MRFTHMYADTHAHTQTFKFIRAHAYGQSICLCFGSGHKYPASNNQQLDDGHQVYLQGVQNERVRLDFLQEGLQFFF